MAQLLDILAYLLKHYPNKSHLSKARVAKMIYLSDWKHVLNYQCQMSDIAWVFDNYGPFVKDVQEVAAKHAEIFRLEPSATVYGNKKTLLALRTEDYQPQLKDTEKEALDHVINVTKTLTWEKFIHLVYLTYPIIASDRYSKMDLVELAAEYKKMQKVA